MQTEGNEKITIVVGTRITETMQTGIDKILMLDGHVNKADYIRDLIRKDLEKRGLLHSVLIEKLKEI